MDAYMESGDSFLFDEQVISITTQGREHSHSLIIKAIKRAVQAAYDIKQTVPAAEAVAEASPPNADHTTDPQMELMRIHKIASDDASSAHSKVANAPSADARIKILLLEQYGSAASVFDALTGKDGNISKKILKKVCKRLLPSSSAEEIKALRKKLQKLGSVSAVAAFLGAGGSSGSPTKRVTGDSHLAALPPEVPQLPASFKQRKQPHTQLIWALLKLSADDDGGSSTAVTAPKSRVSSQGMVSSEQFVWPCSSMVTCH